MTASLDWLGTHAAEVIAICALAFTAYQAFLQRQQSRVSVRPHVTTFVNRNRKGNVGELEVILMNNGLGPALLNRFQVLRQWRGVRPRRGRNEVAARRETCH